jgi:hypothetical protein
MMGPPGAGGEHEPVLIRVTSGRLHVSPQIQQLIDDVRSAADAFIFLIGGASNMDDAVRRPLEDLLRALSILSDRGVRIAVGDGGTMAGVMEAAGLARIHARRRFPLIGVAPAAEVTVTGEPGKTPLDPHHSHIVVVDNLAWTEARRRQGPLEDQHRWGSETDAMFELFEPLCRDLPSVAIAMNGGSIAIDEMQRHIEVSRKIILVAGSGRMTDAFVSVLRDTPPQDEESGRLADIVRSKGLASRRDLFEVFDISNGPERLADTIVRLVGR